MNSNISKLYAIANKKERLIIGLMSGTSFDGLDIALCLVKGEGLRSSLKVLNFATKEFESEFKEDLKSIFAKKTVSLEKLTLLNAKIGTYHAELILECLTEWGLKPNDIDLIASHGQTIYHCPKHQHRLSGYPNATLQIGDGDHIARKTGIITLSDFRQKHIAAGAEGAPLAVYGDYLLFSAESESRIMLNIGGISNFTFLPQQHGTQFFSSDVGPGNTLMDQFVQATYPGMYYDKNAELAKAGKVNPQLVNALIDHPFFSAKFPKTTGPELFNLNYLNLAIEKIGETAISPNDVLASLVNFTAAGIILAIETCTSKPSPFEIYISGGGMHNPMLLNLLESHFNKKLKTTSDLGINPDAKEAVLFAILANESVAGGRTDFGSHPGVPSISMGKICFAD